MDGPGGHHPEWGNPITKEHTWYALTDKWILAQKLGIPKIQFTDHMKLKKKEDQRVDASVLLRSRNKLLAGGNMEKGYEAETEGKAIQRLPHLGIHPINRHQTQTVLWMPKSAYWQEPEIVVPWEALPEPDRYRGRPSKSTIGVSTGPPVEELEKRLKEMKGFATS